MMTEDSVVNVLQFSSTLCRATTHSCVIVDHPGRKKTWWAHYEWQKSSFLAFCFELLCLRMHYIFNNSQTKHLWERDLKKQVFYSHVWFSVLSFNSNTQSSPLIFIKASSRAAVTCRLKKVNTQSHNTNDHNSLGKQQLKMLEGHSCGFVFCLS